MVTCRKCGTELSGPFCGVCGTPAENTDAPAPPYQQQPYQQHPYYQQPYDQQPQYQQQPHQQQFPDYSNHTGALPQMSLVGPPEYRAPRNTKKWLSIGIVAAVLVAGAGVGAWFIFSDNSDDNLAGAEQIEYNDIPTLGPSTDLDELFDDVNDGTGDNVQVLAVTDDLYTLSGYTTDLGDDYQAFVAGISRETGAVSWKLDTDDLAPDGLTDSGNFYCSAVDEASSNIICGATGYDGGTETTLTVINPTDGTFSSIEVDGSFFYSFDHLDTNVVLSSDDHSGDATVFLINALSGEEVWSVDTESASYGLPFSYVLGRYVFVSQIDYDDTSSQTSLLLDPATGEQIAEFDGRLYGNGFNTESPLLLTPTEYDDLTYRWQGIQSVDLDGTVLWSNEDLQVVGAGEGGPVIAAERTDDIGSQDLVALDPSNGTELWTYQDTEEGYIADIRGQCLIYVPYSADDVLLINTRTGEELASPRGRVAGTSPSLAYIINSSNLTAYSTDGGAKVWQVDIADLDRSVDEISVEVESNQGYLFVYDEDEIRMLLPS